VSSAAEPGRWQLAVANTGATLDPSTFARLLQGQAGDQSGRTGLGLWITARILHTLGGTLELSPPDGSGPFATTLLARFPLRDSPPTR
jgi:signal transduction histidine kinase